MDSLIYNFEQLNVDNDNWNDLFAKILKERDEKGLTITAFLDCCGLD